MPGSVQRKNKLKKKSCLKNGWLNREEQIHFKYWK